MTQRERMKNGNIDRRTTHGTLYRVKIREKIDGAITDWFGGLEIQVTNDATILQGRLVDQSDLQGLLRKIHDLHLTLISVETLSEAGEAITGMTG
jgi:hypothetical protein